MAQAVYCALCVLLVLSIRNNMNFFSRLCYSSSWVSVTLSPDHWLSLFKPFCVCLTRPPVVLAWTILCLCVFEWAAVAELHYSSSWVSMTVTGPTVVLPWTPFCVCVSCTVYVCELQWLSCITVALGCPWPCHQTTSCPSLDHFLSVWECVSEKNCSGWAALQLLGVHDPVTGPPVVLLGPLLVGTNPCTPGKTSVLEMWWSSALNITIWSMSKPQILTLSHFSCLKQDLTVHLQVNKPHPLTWVTGTR